MAFWHFLSIYFYTPYSCNTNYILSMLEILYESKKYLENRIEEYFGDGQIYTGDQGYQDLLQRLDEIEEEIEELENSSEEE